MKTYKVVVSRTQIQTVEFVVQAENSSLLKSKLEEIDFGEIDHRFEEGEIESIDYEVRKIFVSKKPLPSSFADEDLQELI